MSQFKDSQEEKKKEFFLTQFFILFGSSTNQMRLTHIRECKVLCSVCELNGFTFLKMMCNQNPNAVDCRG